MWYTCTCSCSDSGSTDNTYLNGSPVISHWGLCSLVEYNWNDNSTIDFPEQIILWHPHRTILFDCCYLDEESGIYHCIVVGFKVNPHTMVLYNHGIWGIPQILFGHSIAWMHIMSRPNRKVIIIYQKKVKVCNDECSRIFWRCK